jgi:hypothetical protein
MQRAAAAAGQRSRRAPVALLYLGAYPRDGAIANLGQPSKQARNILEEISAHIICQRRGHAENGRHLLIGQGERSRHLGTASLCACALASAAQV